MAHDTALVQIVVAQQNFHDDELSYLKKYFRAAGARVLVAGTEKSLMRGMSGSVVMPDNTIGGISVAALDALVIAGGNGSPQYLWGNELLQGKIRQAYQKGRVIGASGLSSVALAHAGILSGRKASMYPSSTVTNEFKRYGVAYVDDPVVVSGTIVTSKGPEHIRSFVGAVQRLIVATRA
ncbi:MAG TPA: DJ-1/PfpI family protein [Methanocella sp.]|nr:DJ-1/PfpI family protein [Methanocella sp.]